MTMAPVLHSFGRLLCSVRSRSWPAGLLTLAIGKPTIDQAADAGMTWLHCEVKLAFAGD